MSSEGRPSAWRQLHATPRRVSRPHILWNAGYDEAATLGRRLILRCRPGDGIDLARQLCRSLAARRHSDMRAVRLLDGDRFITDVVNYCLPLNHHDTSGAPNTGLMLEHSERRHSQIQMVPPLSPARPADARQQLANAALDRFLRPFQFDGDFGD